MATASNNMFGAFKVNRTESAQNMTKCKFLSKIQTFNISNLDQTLNQNFFNDSTMASINSQQLPQSSHQPLRQMNKRNQTTKNNNKQQFFAKSGDNDYLTNRINCQVEIFQSQLNEQDFIKNRFNLPKPVELDPLTKKKIELKEKKIAEQKKIQKFLNSIPNYKFIYTDENTHKHMNQKSYTQKNLKEILRSVKLCNIKDHLNPNKNIIGDPLLEHFNIQQKFIPEGLEELKKAIQEEQQEIRTQFVNEGNLKKETLQQSVSISSVKSPLRKSKEERKNQISFIRGSQILSPNSLNMQRKQSFLQVYNENNKDAEEIYKSKAHSSQKLIEDNLLKSGINLKSQDNLKSEKTIELQNQEKIEEIQIKDEKQIKLKNQFEKLKKIGVKKIEHQHIKEKNMQLGIQENNFSEIEESSISDTSNESYTEEQKQLFKQFPQIYEQRKNLKKLETYQYFNKELQSEVGELQQQDIHKAVLEFHEMEKKRKNMIKQVDLNVNQQVQEIIKMDADQLHKMVMYIEKLNKNFQMIIKEKEEIFKEKKFEHWLKGHDQILSEQEMKYLRNCFEIKAQNRHSNQLNWVEIDSIVKDLKFFSKYAYPTRVSLLKVAEYVKFDANTVVFKQGDIGNYMYIILRGSVNVRVHRQIGDYSEEKIVAVLYDGFHFGELSMMHTESKRQEHQNVFQAINAKSLKYIRDQLSKYDQISKYEEVARQKGKSKEDIEQEKALIKKKIFEDDSDNPEGTIKTSEQQGATTKRAATIVTSDNCEMLRITKELFNTVLMELMQDELDIKIKLLASLNLFDQFQPFALIPIANLLKQEKYCINDIIIHQYREFNKFYFVQKGRLKIVRVEEIVRSQKLSDYAVSFKKKPKPFYCGKSQYYNGKIKIYERDQHQIKDDSFNKAIQDQVDAKNQLLDIDQYDLDHPLRKPEFEDTYQVFDYEKKYHDVEGEFKYLKFTEYGKFTTGDYFGARALTGIPLEMGRMESQLSIIADTNDVELYSLRKDQLQYLPLTLKMYFLNQLEAMRDFDNFKLDKESQNIQAWDKAKEIFYREKLKEQAVAKNVPKYKEY